MSALLDLSLIVFFVSGGLVILGLLEWILRACDGLGRRLRGLPVYDGDD